MGPTAKSMLMCIIIITRHHSAEQGREAPGECPVTPFGLDVGPVTCRGVTVFIHNRFFDHVNFD